jgi:membrane associated rhomboid family serine protease
VSKLRITYNSPVVLTYALISAIVLMLPDSMRSWFVTYPSFKYGAHSWVGLFTHIFGHENWQHLSANFMFILLIGPILEERHGSLSLAAMLLVTALVEALVNMVFTNVPMLGASGTVFMMIILASTSNIRAGDIPLTFIAVALIYMGGEVVAAVRADDHVSHLTHLVGGLAGAAFGFFGAAAPKPSKAPKPAPAPEPVKPLLTQKSPGTAATSDRLRKS